MAIRRQPRRHLPHPKSPFFWMKTCPPLESLTTDSDYSGFLSPGVSETLRRLALRKLFHAPEFNLCDGLDDYDDDFRTFAELGSMVTVEMRKRLEGVLEEKGTAVVDADALADTAKEAQMTEEPRDEEPDDEELDEELG